MDVLIKEGFSIEEIQNMLDTNLMIEAVEDRSIYELLSILKDIGCSKEHIKNIFICNPFCLTNDNSGIMDLINKLKEIGFDSLYTLFDSNPYLLNFSANDMDDFYHRLIDGGMSKEEFFDYLNYHFIY